MLANIKYFIKSFILVISLNVLLTSCNNKSKFNVLIVTIDTTRADYIGVYGKETAMTPYIDALAQDGVLYRNAYSPVPITLPAHSTIMTGKVPFTHGVRDNGIFVLSDSNVTLAEILENNGYKTAATIGAFPLTKESGINQGFQYFNDSIQKPQTNTTSLINKNVKSGLLFKERKAAQVNSSIIPWIKENKNSPFFTWIHYYDPHFPHNPPSPYYSSFINDLYQGEIAYSDENFGEIIKLLKSLDIYDNTLIILTSDHGEGLGDHNELTHTSLIYNSTLHVPLIVKYPNQTNKGTVIKQNVGLVDIFPSILNVLNIPSDIEVQGSILPTTLSNSKDIEIYAETLSSKISRGWGEQRGLIKNEYKYIYGPKKELYNIVEDPKELNNIINIESSRADEMKIALQDYIDEHQNGNTSAIIEVSDSTLEILRGLGYLQVTNNETSNMIQEKLDDSGDAPQDHIKDVSLYYEAKNLFLTGEYSYANRLINTLLDSDPDNLLVLELKILLEMSLGNFSSAEKHILNLPENSYGVLTKSEKLYFLGKIQFESKNYDKSKVYLKESLKADSNIGALFLLSEIALKSNENELYRSYLEEILKTNNNDIDLMNTLAISYYQSKNIGKAEKLFKNAIKKNPFYHNTFFNYAIFLKLEKRYDESILHLSKAIDLNKHYYKAHFSLIELLLLTGNQDKASRAFKNFELISKNNLYYNQAKTLLKK